MQRPILILGTSVVLVVAALGWQRQAGARLRGEVERLRDQRREWARVAAENRRLAAAQVSAAELENLHANQAAVTRLRDEIETLRRRTEEQARGARVQPPKPHVPTMADEPVAAAQWRNAGRATPQAVFETVLWAAAGGDIEAIAASLVLDPDALTKARELLAGLPATARAQFTTPEQLIASLTTKDVPLGSAQILGQFPVAEGTKLVARLIDPQGKSKVVLLSVRPDGANWRLVVPGSVVGKYAAMLQAPVAGTGR